jgi:hypothetical protein
MRLVQVPAPAEKNTKAWILRGRRWFRRKTDLRWSQFHNVVIWRTEQPLAQIEHQLDYPKVDVFCAVAPEKVHVPLFVIEAIVTCDSLLDIMENWLSLQLNTNYDNYGAPPIFTGMYYCFSTALDRTCCKWRKQPSPFAFPFAGSYTMRFLSLRVR